MPYSDEAKAVIARMSAAKQITQPAAYRVEFTTHTGFVDTHYQKDGLTEADKQAGFVEIPLYEDPSAEIERLKTALKAAEKFIPVYEPWMDKYSDREPWTHHSAATLGDLRRVRAALKAT
jgi:hypothetical protein